MNKLEELENIFADSHICEIQAKFNKIECSAEKCDNCPLGIGDGVCLKNTFELKWKLQKEIQSLKKENQKLKKDYNLLDTTMESDDRIICELLKEKECLKNDIKLNEAQIDDLTLEVANYKHALEEKNEIIMDLKEDLRLTTIERTTCEDKWYKEHLKCCELDNALDKACEMIGICPHNVNIEECEKVENECKECWKKYFLSEVLE